MEFQLPSNLRTELVPYDPALKRLRAEAKATKGRKQAKYPLGNVNDIIPEEIVRKERLQAAVDHINGAYAPQRFSSFHSDVPNGDGTSEPGVTAILYHYEQCWVAAWLPPVGQEDKYVYGFTYAIKDTEAARRLNRHILGDMSKFERVAYGRSYFFVRKQYVTVKDIKEGQDQPMWKIGYINYGKGGNINHIMTRFHNSVAKTVPQWSDARGIFERLKDGSIFNVLFDTAERTSNYWKQYEESGKSRYEWQPDVANVLDLIDKTTVAGEYYMYYYKDLAKIRHIIDKPFFRKYIQTKCDEVLAVYNNKENDLKLAIQQPWNQLFALLIAITRVHHVWPDCPIDYYQNHIDVLLGVDISAPRLWAREWLAKHMTPASFFGILKKHYDQQLADKLTGKHHYGGYYIKQSIGITVFSFHEWNDTCNMISTILDAGKTLEPPKRWRITEFHDYVQSEAWKIKNPNHSLPQDLFPAPVKIDYTSRGWSFFQPVDTHQLSAWGQAVRNCIGNASSYAEGVRKKKHFIVLCMVDGKPTFTVQLKVNNGLMSVDQIVGMSNSRLTSEQQTDYKEAFRLALNAREDQLKSKG